MCPNTSKIYFFDKYKHSLNDEEYWENLTTAYMLQEFSYNEPYEIYKQLFRSTRKYKEKIMTEEEQQILANLTDEVVVYRGMSTKEEKSGNYRFSWTLDKMIAEKFAKRNKTYFKQKTMVKEMTIPKKDITAYFNSREEKEIIYISST